MKARKKKPDELGLSDRLVTGGLAVVIALVFGTGVWLACNWRLTLTNPLDPAIIPYWPVLVFALVMGLIGLALGPEKTMDIFEKMWRRDE